MNEDEMKEIVETFRYSIINDNSDRYLLLLVKEVERIVRHRAVDHAYTLANTIRDMNKN
jgi:hypothetical protein